jgi:hypothetical protein
MILSDRLEILAVDSLLPYPPFETFNQPQRRALAKDPAFSQNGHRGAKVGNIFNNMSRENDDDIFSDLSQEIEEPVSFFRVEASRWLVDND